MKRLAALIAGLGLLVGFPGKAPQDEAQRLVVTGTATLAPLMEKIARRFEDGHPDVRIRVESSSSLDAVAATRAGLADVGMISRPLLPGEAGLRVYPLARDGV